MKFSSVVLASIFCVSASASATLPRSKKLLKGAALATASYLIADPYLRKLKYSEESLNFWAKELTGPNADFLFDYGLYPEFVLSGRHGKNRKTVFLDTLYNHETGVSEKLLKAGACPNAKDADGTDLISFAGFQSFSPSLLQSAIDHGLRINERDLMGTLPLDRLLKGSNLENARVLIRAGAVSSLSWADLILSLASDFPAELPVDSKDFKESWTFSKHRLIVEIYRASGRDKSILEKAAYRRFWRLNPNMTVFLTKIDEFDQMLD